MTQKKKTREGRPVGSAADDEQVEHDIKGQSGNPALLEKVYKGIELEAQRRSSRRTLLQFAQATFPNYGGPMFDPKR